MRSPGVRMSAGPALWACSGAGGRSNSADVSTTEANAPTPGHARTTRPRSGPLLNRRPAEVAWPHIYGRWADQAVVLQLLDHVGGPSRRAADGEDRCEELRGHAHRMQDQRGVELDVRVKITPRLELRQ